MESSSSSTRPFAYARVGSHKRIEVEDGDKSVTCYCHVPTKIWTIYKEINRQRRFCGCANFWVSIGFYILIDFMYY